MAASQIVSFRLDPGAAEIARGMEKWASLVEDFGPAWHAIEGLTRRHHARTFDSVGAATGTRRRPWARLTPKYEAWKARHFPGRPILVRTGALRRAMVDGGAGSATQRTTKSLVMGLRGEIKDRAGWHQFGTRRMVARPPFQLDPDPRPSGTYAYAVGQILQRVVVDARKKALGVEGYTDSSAFDRQVASLDRLSRRETR